MDFGKEKKGYNKAEVDKYISELSLRYESQLSQKGARIDELKKSLSDAEEKIKKYDQKKNLVAKAIFNAVAKADEIEKLATIKYNQEIEQLRAFHDKWIGYYNKMLQAYPLDDDILAAGEFNNRMKKILSHTNEAQPQVSDVARQELEKNFENESRRINEKQVGYIKIKVGDKNDEDDSLLKEILPDADMSSPIVTGNFDPVERISRYFSSKKSNETAASANVEDEFSDRAPSGFSFEEALNPKEDLAAIMRELGLLIDD